MNSTLLIIVTESSENLNAPRLIEPVVPYLATFQVVARHVVTRCFVACQRDTTSKFSTLLELDLSPSRHRSRR